MKSPAGRGLVRENEGPSTIESVRDFTVRTSTTKDNGLYVQAVKMLVDSGASVTVLNSHFMNKVEGDILMTDAGLEMPAADGHTMPFTGHGKLEVCIGNVVNKQSVVRRCHCRRNLRV